MEKTGQELCKESIKIVEDLYETYKNDEYMQIYIYNYFTTHLKTVLENMKMLHITRQTHMQEMNIEQDNFIQSFLNNHKYFYVPQNNRFFMYDETHFLIASEDDVLHHILTEISKDKRLLVWKKKTKITIMKRIKENLLFRAIPNSETIQYVLDLFCPLLFSTKTEVKYFLTVLGDNMLKKKSDIVHFISPKAKFFLQEINYCVQMLTCANAIQSFKHKYHEHSYTNCRLIRINEHVKNTTLWEHIMSYFLDVICVCFHYSNRYENADEFIQHRNTDKEVEDSILFLHNHSQESIVDMFIRDCMIPCSTGSSREISWKTMQYLWKQFLDARELPAIMFQSNLKHLLIQKWQKMENTVYDETSDQFIGMFSKFLPSIQSFLQFWNEYMVYDPTEMDLELDEIATLFCKHMDGCNTKKGEPCKMTEKQIMDLISYFFPNVEIECNKYMHKYKCTLWDKSLDIMTVLAGILSSDVSNNHEGSLFSVYDCYNKYCQINQEQKKPCVSKQYFEKYIAEHWNNANFI